MDAHSHILNEPQRTSLLGSQVYFEESDLGLKKLNIFPVKFKAEWTSLLGNQVYFEESDLGLKKLHKGREPYKQG